MSTEAIALAWQLNLNITITWQASKPSVGCRLCPHCTCFGTRQDAVTEHHRCLISWFLQPGGFEEVLIATIVLFHFSLDTWDIHPSAGSFLNHFST